MKPRLAILLLATMQMLTVACTKDPSRPSAVVALEFVRETKTVPLFRAGFASSAPSAGTVRERFDSLSDEEIEQVFVAEYVVEWDSGTLEDIVSFIRSDAGKEYLESALAQAAGSPKAISTESQRSFRLFTSTHSGIRWLEGMRAIQPRVVSRLMKKIGGEPGATDNPDHRNLKTEKPSSTERTQPGV